MSQLADTNRERLQSFFKPREVLIAGVVLLLILASLGIISLVQMPTRVATAAQATAAVQMKAISTAYVATGIAHNAATAAAQAHSTATVEARATATAVVMEATATALAAGNPYPPHNGTLALDDSLHNNSTHAWSIGSDKDGSCQFAGGAYHAQAKADHIIYYCTAFETNYSNFVFQVQMTFISGSGGGGITFRQDSQGNSYNFIIRPYGSYGFYKFTKDQTEGVLPNPYGPAGSIKGLKRTNMVTVIARGKSLDLYVNNRRVSGLNDGSFSSGFIAVNAETRTGPSEVSFTNAKAWTL